MELLTLLWNEVITKPMTNSLLVLYVWLGSNLGLSIIAFTIIVRALTYPLVVRQLRQTRKLQGLQPRVKEINEKYKNNPQVRGQEVMKLYKEMGVNPVGCLGPLVIQMPIFIGLFWAINGVLPFTPENLAGLSSKLYSWLPFLDTAVPVERNFLGMDLALEPMRVGSILGYTLVALSGLSMFVQQKMSQVASPDPAQQSTQRMMLFMFPVMFGMFSLFFPIGLVIYWVASTLIGIVMQYFVTGWGGLFPQAEQARGAGTPRLGPTLSAALPDKEEGDGRPEPRPVSEDSRGSNRTRNPGARRRSRRNRNRRH
ncbi:MAG: YidC/Oxa1 family membrane protein insertase [Chloroflexota bacterium]|nr:YidC/Oxa1 family membrane protein insertase [Chloroflexota bacterium]MDE2885508.1 YidC/Oxa1 family membrane protein insertase [Chloroflexota bacterium]